MINTEIYEFETKLYELAKSMPVSVAYFVVSKLAKDLDTAYRQTVAMEARKTGAATQEEEEASAENIEIE